MVLDGDTPPLNKLTVVGVLEIPDTMNDTTSSRHARSLPAFRTVVIEATYISIQVRWREGETERERELWFLWRYAEHSTRKAQRNVCAFKVN